MGGRRITKAAGSTSAVTSKKHREICHWHVLRRSKRNLESKAAAGTRTATADGQADPQEDDPPATILFAKDPPLPPSSSAAGLQRKQSSDGKCGSILSMSLEQLGTGDDGRCDAGYPMEEENKLRDEFILR